jgi:coenzyme PQQ precursor peptide PqqA
MEQDRAAIDFLKNPGLRRKHMKLEWHKPEVVEEEVGLEVTSYSSAELDRS